MSEHLAILAKKENELMMNVYIKFVVTLLGKYRVLGIFKSLTYFITPCYFSAFSEHFYVLRLNCTTFALEHVAFMFLIVIGLNGTYSLKLM